MKNDSTTTYRETHKFRITLAVTSGVFTFVFLLFFQPFGVNNYRPDEKITVLLTSVLFVFSSIATGTILLMEFVVYPWLFSKKQPKKYLVWIVMEFVVTASATFMFYNIIGNFHDFYLASYFKHILEIGSVLVIPFVGTHFYFRHSKVVHDYKNVLSISGNNLKREDIILLSGEYKNDQIALPLQSIQYIQSENNYASLHYLEDNMPRKYMIRATLTGLEKKLGCYTIIRINRSFMVNLMHLETFKNDSGKLKLKLSNVPKTFEVSKSYRVKVVQQLAQYTH